MLKGEEHNNPSPTPSPSPSSRTSRLGSSLKFNGELSGSGGVVIEGGLEGKIRLADHDVTVEPGGRVKADIVVRNLTIRGSVEGNIQAAGMVLIEKSGRMAGDISAARISVVEGAQFKGSVKITRS